MTIKNEQQYIDEWLDYHLGLGIDKVLLWEDIGSVPHDVSKYPQDRVILKHISDIENLGKKNRQITAYEESFPILKEMGCTWAAFIDADEFIRLEDGYSLDRMAEEFSGETGLILYWENIGSDGKTYNEPDIPVQDRFRKRCEYSFTQFRAFFKVFVNLDRCDELKNIHYAEGAVNPDGSSKIRKQGVFGDKMWLTHYCTKSWEEWCMKFIVRGDMFPGNRRLSEYFQNNREERKMKDKMMELYKEWKICFGFEQPTT